MTKTIKILHAESKDYCPEAKRILNSFAQVDYLNLDRVGIAKRIADYDGLIIRLRNSVDHKLIQNAERLKMIAANTTGTNHIQVNGRIKVISLKGERLFLDSIFSTAEHTLGLILSLTRHIPEAKNAVLQGRWDNEEFRGRELFGKTIGIIGFGRLGRMVARYANGFGMNMLAYDNDKTIKYMKCVKHVSLDILLSESDIVSIHLPLTPSTQNFINDSRIRKMKKGSILINTSRGTIVNEPALLKYLKNGHLAGAALDVICGEECPGFQPKKNKLILYARKHENLLITPHIGGSAIEAVKKTDVFIANKIRQYFKGF